MEIENTQLRSVKTHISSLTISLPPEIVEEILSWLPVKSLLKFRCVSKSWRSVIRSQRFIDKHLANSTKNATFSHHGIVLNSLEPHCGIKQCSLRSFLDDPIIDQFRVCEKLNLGKGTIRVVGVCNGLVCILYEGKHFILWNPATRVTKKLPEVDCKIRHGHMTCYGFGFDCVSGDYKVFGILSMFWVTGGYEGIFKVYSLQANSWKVVKKGGVSPFSEEGRFASGKLHWRKKLGLGPEIVSFDFRSEAYGVLELPCFGKGFFESMKVIGGRLALLCDYRSRLDVWIMKEYGVRESWEKVVTVPQIVRVERSYAFPALLALGPNGEVLLTYGPSFVINYPEGDWYRQLQVKTPAPFRDAQVYVESLVSLGEEEGVLPGTGGVKDEGKKVSLEVCPINNLLEECSLFFVFVECT